MRPFISATLWRNIRLSISCGHAQHHQTMIQCQNCGKSNTPESHFCRYCGHQFVVRQQQSYDYSPPRPYAWKTDEFQTSNEARASKTADHAMPPGRLAAPHQFHAAAQMTYRGPQDLSGQYRCPNCGTNYLPVLDRRISTAGWITFSLLLVFTLIFFWVGLLMKEDVPICPICKRRVG